jgi:predicted DNA-binding transcriptional regulator AlpA
MAAALPITRVSQMARELGIHRNTIYAWCNRLGLPASSSGRERFVEWEQLRRWFARKEAAKAPDRPKPNIEPARKWLESRGLKIG